MAMAFLPAGSALAQTVSLQPAASPSTIRPGQSATLTGSGFPVGTIDVATVQVRLEPKTALAGPVATVPAATLTTVAGSTRRVTFSLPASFPLPAATDYWVGILTTAGAAVSLTTSTRSTLRIEAGTATWTLDPAEGFPGQALSVRITAPVNTFSPNLTTANFGPGIRTGGAPAAQMGVLSVSSTNQAMASLAVDPDAALGPRDVTIRIGTIELALPGRFRIVAAPPTPPQSTAPTLVSMTPALAAPGATVVLSGTAFPTVAIVPAKVTVRLNPVVTGSSPQVTTTATSLTPLTGSTSRELGFIVPASLRPSAPVQYQVSVIGTTETGVAFTSTNFLLLTVTPSGGAPRILSLNPSSGNPGQTLTVQMAVEGFGANPAGLRVSFGSGISVGGDAEGAYGPVTATANTLTAVLRISPTAAPGARAVTVVSGNQGYQAPVPFTVGASPVPLVSSIEPNSAQPGASVSLRIRGINTGFAAGRVQVSLGEGITVSNVTVVSPVELTVPVQVAATAGPGARTLTVTVDGRILTMANAFTVGLSGRLISLTPPTGSTGLQVPITITGQGTAFQMSGLTVNLGSGINVGSIVATSPTVLTARAEILPTAVPGPRTLTVAYGAQSLTLPNAFAVTGPTITILTPSSLSFVNTPAITVTGKVSDPRATIAVNGVAAPNTGGSFTTSIPLQEGNNTISAVATTPEGAAVSTSIQITLDTTPPRVTILSPSPSQETTEATVTVAGSVNDIVVGTVNDQEAQVTVNGIRAAVSNRTFEARNVPVSLGANVIRAEARDRVGNPASASVSIIRKAASLLKMAVLSGNSQSSSVGSVLPQPLVVRLTDDFDQPLAGRSVFFRVALNNGMVGNVSTDASSTAVEVKTDTNGQARAFWKLGERSGAGNNRVEAYSTGLTAPAVFNASGVNGSPARIIVDSGLNQSGAVNDKLPLPFVAVVTDANHNRLGGVPVKFTVRSGGGKINGVAETTFTSDSDGRVAALLELGPNEGPENNEVVVSFEGNTSSPAIFTASGRIPKLLADTRVTGTVFDNANNPIAGVTMRLYRLQQGTTTNLPVQVGTPVVSNGKGYFEMVGAPVGVFKLMADGTTVAGAKKYPTLEFDLTVVSGNNNSIGMPIYLPALDTVNRLCVDETTGGTLTLPDVPGFSLTVAAGSATFPGGSKKGCVSVTPVNIDKVPMTPGFGQQPRFVITIQPVGTQFNPPAAMTIPNVDGLKPRATTEMYSYDHDLASFVSIGPGVVSEDGLLVQTAPGAGVLKAGWHCGGDPAPPDGVAADCPECRYCVGNRCVPNPGQNQQCCQQIGLCSAGNCRKEEICRGLHGPPYIRVIYDNGSIFCDPRTIFVGYTLLKEFNFPENLTVRGSLCGKGSCNWGLDGVEPPFTIVTGVCYAKMAGKLDILMSA